MSNYIIYFQSKGINNAYLNHFARKVVGIAVCPFNEYIDKEIPHLSIGYKHSNVDKKWPKIFRYLLRYIEGVFVHLHCLRKLALAPKGTIYWSLFYFLWFEKLTIYLLSKWGFQIVLVVHDFNQEMFNEINSRTGINHTKSKILKFYQQFNCVAHTNKLTKQLISLGVSTNYFPFPPMEFKTLLKVERDIDFLLIGTYRKSKNFESALDKILSVSPESTIYCCSYGLPEEFLKSYSGKICVENRFLSDLEMMEYLSRTNYVVLPYRIDRQSVPETSAQA